jgi:hypothetical protein
MTPDSLPDPIEIAVEFAELLERLGIRYLVGGSLASSVHGEPRSTNDVDVVADFSQADVAPFLKALGPGYYVDETAVRGAMRSGGSFNVIHMDTAVKVDVFVAGADPFNQERLRLAERVEVWREPAASMFIDTAEHSVLRKLEWYRRAGEVSERQWRDVVAILRVQGATLDDARLDEWAARLQVTDLLKRARAEVSASSGG